MEQEITAAQNLVNASMEFIVAYGFQILGAIIVLLIGFHLSKWIATAVIRVCDKRGLDVTLSRFFANVTRVVVLGFVIIIALGKFGITIAPFIAAIGAIAFGASLAIQGPLSNFGAGIAIILGRPFVVGNTISVRDVSGVVEEIRLSATLLSTEDGEEITIPNNRILGEILYNSFANKVVEASVGISYEHDPHHAVSVVRNALDTVESVTTAPSAQVGIERFGDSAIEIGYRFWVPTNEYHQVRFRANAAVYDALKAAEINIPYPKLELLNAAREPSA